MILIIDNYDSFVYNLFQYLGELGAEPIVRRNDEVTVDEITKMSPDGIVLSPGPGHPANKRDFGVCEDVLSQLEVPTLGVCLGHQGIINHFGGTIVKNTPMHGKTSMVKHDGKGIFSGVRNPLRVMRYHSLAGEDIPECLEVSARSEDGCVMGVRHRERPIFGLQFHPESILTEDGKRILENFVRC